MSRTIRFEKCNYIESPIKIEESNVFVDCPKGAILWTDRDINIFEIDGKALENINLTGFTVKHLTPNANNKWAVKIGGKHQLTQVSDSFFYFDFIGNERTMISRNIRDGLNPLYTGNGAGVIDVDLDRSEKGSWFFNTKISGNWAWVNKGLRIVEQKADANQFVNTIKTDLWIHSARQFFEIDGSNMCDLKIHCQSQYSLKTNFDKWDYDSEEKFEQVPHTDEELNLPPYILKMSSVRRDILVFDLHKGQEQWKRAGKHLAMPINEVKKVIYAGLEELNLKR